MKALVLAAALAALVSTAPAGAARDVHKPAGVDAATVTVMADASRLGSAGLTSLNGNGHWTPANRQAAAADADFDTAAPQIDTGTLIVLLGVLAFVVSRPIARMLRRQEQQRRATALASTLDHSTR